MNLLKRQCPLLFLTHPNFISGFLLLILTTNNFIAAKTYYVRSASEISTAMQTALPGDTLLMATGTWTNQKIVFKGNGNSTKSIYLIAETAGQVTLSGTSTLRIGGNYLVVDGVVFKNGYSSSGGVIEFRDDSGNESNYCRLTNSAIIDFNPPSTSSDYKWVSLYGTHNRVDHCYLKGKTHLGTTLVVWRSTTRADYHLIDSNYFGQRPPFPENGAETIRVGTSDQSLSSSFTVVEYNYFEECNGETEIISNKSCENIYRYNTFKDCQGTLTLRHGNKCTVEGNFFLCGNKTNSGGIRIIGEDHKVLNNYIENSYGESFKSAITIMNGVPNSPLNRYFQVKRALVVFNSVVNSRVTLNIGAGKDSELTLPPLDCKIVNNIFYSNQSPLVTFSDNPINLIWSGNIFYGAAIGMPLPVNNYNDNPQLIRSSDNLYRLTSTSPAINRSDTLFKPVTKDMDGQQRIGIYDAGADEYSQDSIIIKPLTKNVVGPKWMQIPVSVEETIKIPSGFSLEQNYPNPFNPSTKISYSLNEESRVSLKVFDILGKEVGEIVSEEKSAGSYTVDFDASRLSSGIYFFKLSNDERTIIKKGVLLK
jgi:poly(beta-D-mannuronate) lyase